MPVLDIPMLQPTPKADRTDTKPASKVTTPDHGQDQSDADFDTAYANEADDQAANATDDAISVEDTADTNAGKANPAEVDEAQPTLTFGEVQEEDPDNILDEDLTVDDELPTKKPVADTHEVAFAQRLLSAQSTEARTKTSVVESEIGLNGPKPADARAQVETPKAATIATPKETQQLPNASTASPKANVIEEVLRHADVAQAKTVASGSSSSAQPVQAVVGQHSGVIGEATVKAKSDPRAATESEPRIAPLNANRPSNPTAKTATPTATVALVTAAQPLAQLAINADLSGLEMAVSAAGDVDAPTLWDARSPSPGTLAQTLARPETPAMIGRQMAEVLQRLPDRPVELSLNPEELGRVRLSISVAESGITVSVLAERPETLDLMRRHIDQLAREFQTLGYENIGFAFNEGQTEQNDKNADGSGLGADSREPDGSVGDNIVTDPIKLAATSGVDMRL